MPEKSKNMIERLLLVDDDNGFRRSLALNLQYRGYKVSEAQSGMDAIKHLKQFQTSEEAVDGMVIDAKMPGLDGFWLADQVVSLYPRIKIVIISAFSYPESIHNYEILTKPVHITQLIQALNQ